MENAEVIYCVVARSTDILAEYTAKQGNFPQITQTVLNKLPTTPDKKMMSYQHPKGEYTFHVLTSTENGIIFLAMADEDFSQMVAFRFLLDVEKKFR